MSVPLPHLSDTPRQHPDCCVSLSSKLLATISKQLPATDTSILSIGCGSGLLEALLLQLQPSLKLVGVEVVSCNVGYLPVDKTLTASGTRSICPLARDVDVWLFVYPRTTSLVAEYLRNARGARVKTIIWIGPALDWIDFRLTFEASQFTSASQIHDAGLAEYETLVVITQDCMTPTAAESQHVLQDLKDIDDI